ncbi:MAG: 50S ribosomal protein L25/general stress protein Ctc [Sphingobacteriia bacterium]|jgi:large subunit ribosomal protein L25|nr:50S ribosomal protein L25/general stress protein Ctc [Sphingobacteriia bacterium]
MKTFELEGVKRTTLGKKSSKAARANELVPCVIYGGEHSMYFEVKESDLRKLIYTPNIYVVNLNIDGKTTEAILKEIQFHPVSDRILHIDFLEVSDDKPIVMEVPVKLEGLAVGVRAGGKLGLEMRKLKVKALHKDIPELITINVENLELGKTIQVKSIKIDKLEFLNAPDCVICSVKTTRVARGMEEPVAAATPAAAESTPAAE